MRLSVVVSVYKLGLSRCLILRIKIIIPHPINDQSMRERRRGGGLEYQKNLQFHHTYVDDFLYITHFEIITKPRVWYSKSPKSVVTLW